MSVSTGLDFVWYVYSVGKYLNLQRRTCVHGYHGARARRAHLRQRVRLVPLHSLSLVLFVTLQSRNPFVLGLSMVYGMASFLVLVAAISNDNL